MFLALRLVLYFPLRSAGVTKFYICCVSLIRTALDGLLLLVLFRIRI